MKSFSFLFFLFITLCQPASGKDKDSIISFLKNRFEAFKIGQINIEYNFSNNFLSDTLKLSTIVIFNKTMTDNFKYGNFVVLQNTKPTILYNLDTLYKIDIDSILAQFSFQKIEINSIKQFFQANLLGRSIYLPYLKSSFDELAGHLDNSKLIIDDENFILLEENNGMINQTGDTANRLAKYIFSKQKGLLAKFEERITVNRITQTKEFEFTIDENPHDSTLLNLITYQLSFSNSVALPGNFTNAPSNREFDSLLLSKKNIILPDLNGENINLSVRKCKLTVIDFWYINCYPCLKVLPILEILFDKYSNKGVEVLGINSIDKKTKRLENFIKQHNITYPILLDENSEAAKEFGVYGYPTVFIIDNNTCKILLRANGFHEELKSILEFKIEEYLNKNE